jgi:anion-transporting  ArsA/GET3 family ATPase
VSPVGDRRAEGLPDRRERPVTIGELLEARSVCVCAGAGGVGKTTVSAAIAAGMAEPGRRVAVVTIDPARRLADSLGLPHLGNEERRVPPERLAAAGLPAGGELWAMMLDAKRTFDELVERRAPDAATRDAVLSNRIYQELSAAVAGSHEYMAMEKLYELHEEGGYDLLVLDTPPSRNALDFLDAPERLARFIDSRSLQLFLAPGRRGLRALGRSTGVLFSALRRVTGIDLLRDLSDFFGSFGEMAGGFSERAQRVRELLTSSTTSFVLVTSPRSEAIEEAASFRRRLERERMPFGAAVANRVHDLRPAGSPVGAETAGMRRQLAAALGDDLSSRVVDSALKAAALAEHDRASVERLRSDLDGQPLLTVPELEQGVNDLEGLAHVHAHLFRPGDAGPAAAGGSDPSASAPREQT